MNDSLSSWEIVPKLISETSSIFQPHPFSLFFSSSSTPPAPLINFQPFSLMTVLTYHTRGFFFFFFFFHPWKHVRLLAAIASNVTSKNCWLLKKISFSFLQICFVGELWLRFFLFYLDPICRLNRCSTCLLLDIKVSKVSGVSIGIDNRRGWLLLKKGEFTLIICSGNGKKRDFFFSRFRCHWSPDPCFTWVRFYIEVSKVSGVFVALLLQYFAYG